MSAAAVRRRYIVIGAGAVGGTIAGRLAHSGRDVVVVARGAHLEALQRDGLQLRTPEFETRAQIPAVAGPEDLELGVNDVLVLATKTHQIDQALPPWADSSVVRDGAVIGTAGETLPILTALNGVASESIAMRYFDRVFGVAVWLPAVHLEPGEVIARGVPVSGILHISRVPAAATSSEDQQLLRHLSADFGDSGLRVELPDDVMPWKYRKLISNIGNAFQALLGSGGDGEDLITAARDEARAVLAAAGIEVTSDADEGAKRQDSFRVAPVPGEPEQLGGSSWQSLTRGTGSIETDYLNGQIALIAHEQGLRAPVNTAIARLARRAARSGAKPGDTSAGQLAAELGLAPSS